MPDLLRLLVLFAVTINPPAVARSVARAGGTSAGPMAARVVFVGVATALLVYVLAALFADQLMDALEVNPASLRVAAGAVMLVQAAQVIVLGRAPGGAEARASEGGGVFPLGLPWLASAAGLALTLRSAVDVGRIEAIAAAAVIVAVAAALAFGGSRLPTAAMDGLARALAALMAILGTALIVNGVLAV